MPFFKDNETAFEQVSKNVCRRVFHLEKLMLVILQFENGPWPEAEPLHQHMHEQCSYLAEGELEFTIEGEGKVSLKVGDAVAIPSHAMHTVRLVSESAKLIDAFSPIRQEFLA